MIKGIGIGFRRDIADEIMNSDIFNPDFIEFAPENWIGLGGYWGNILHTAINRFPTVNHGLSLSIGSPEPPDQEFLRQLKDFLDNNKVQIYSEHLSYSKFENAHLYDLLPIPFTKDAIDHVVARLKEVQDFLGRAIAIENVSYYTPVAPEMPEIDFLNQIVAGSECNLLLDVNNVYVNAFNHGYDAQQFISDIPLDKVSYIHMAGHKKISDDLIIDTHGEPIIDPVYKLFDFTVQKMKPVPVLLERDYNFDDLESIAEEMNVLRTMSQKYWEVPDEAIA